ncbi:hypothetical protein MMC27_002924 [Xylographa pallens]|nr:hypothetical protein [Xylographa pallens]
MTRLSSEPVDEVAEGLAATPVVSTSDSTASGMVRRSTRAHTGRTSLNVEDMAQTAEVAEPNVQKRKRAPVSKKTPVRDSGILKKMVAYSKGSAANEEDEIEETEAGAKRKNGPPKAPTPRKRPKIGFTKVPENVLVRRTPKKQPETPVQPAVPVLPRPEPHGAPPAWAESRQALCETLPYYRAFNSGAYTSGGLAHGFLLNLDSTAGSLMNEEIVITRAGGHCGRNEFGEMEQISDHSADESCILSFKNNMNCQYPLALIVGKQNTDCPTVIPHQYCVMDWFQVTDIWPEKKNAKVCFKFRFEKIDRTTKSWWAPKGSPEPVRSVALPPCAYKEDCYMCGESSKQIFEHVWMCLNNDCSEFWRIDGHEVTCPLTYNPVFLEERTHWRDEIKPPYDLAPRLPQPNSPDEASYAFNRACWKGIVCPKCKRCTSRRHWDAWRCETQDCGFTYNVPQPVLAPTALMGGHDVETTGHAVPRDQAVHPVTMQLPVFNGGWRIHTYELCPGNTITHFHANESVNQQSGGANELFKALQKDNCMGLQRFPMKMHAGTGEVLAQHFSLNYGMPYKYVVAVDSKAFSAAPTPIINALKRLNSAAKAAICDGSFVSFNELLAVGYFEAGKMGFHDDGEKELGPTIATLSLGGSAVMSMRMKSRYFTGLTKGGNYDPLEPVLPGSFLEEERKSLNARWPTVTADQFEQWRKALYSSRKMPRNGPVLLTMHLSHGDIVVMHGNEMQKYYEHQIVSSGKMRFGLTCRHIKPELVDPADHWKGIYELPDEDDDNAQTLALDARPARVDDPQSFALQDQNTTLADDVVASIVGEAAPSDLTNLVEPAKADSGTSALAKTSTTIVSQGETHFPVFF